MEQVKTIDIILTERCNLQCVYCYEKYKNPTSMSAETAIQIIDKQLLHLDPYNKLVVHLFGGEPFLAFPVIREIIEHFELHEARNKLQFFTTTNGTLVHGKIKEWLEKHASFFICGLSLDGTKEVHDLNRSNSFDLIDLSFFAKNWPKQPIKMTISENTLPSLSDCVIFCHSKGFLVSCNLAYNIDWSADKNVELVERELKKLIQFYIDHPNIQPCSLLNYKIERVATSQNKKYVGRWCGAGIDTCAFSANGKEYPCQFFSPVSIGEKAETIRDIIKFKDEIPSDLLDPKCKDCIVKAICPTCYGANFAQTGNMFIKDNNYCRLTKIIIMSNSYFKAKLWKLGRLKMSDKRIPALLKSIEIIQKQLIIN